MNQKVLLLLISVIAVGLTTFGRSNCWAEETKEEYFPIPELTEKASKPSDDYSIFDDVRIHAGAALINSFQDLEIAPGIRERGGLRGIQIGLGVDLFNPHWIAEGDIVSLPESAIGDSRVSSNGFELRLLYETPIIEGVTVHGGLGLASRNYHVKTSNRPDGLVAAGEASFASGATVLAAGADYWPTESVSAGIELANHIPMANGDDPSSYDLAIRINGHF